MHIYIYIYIYIYVYISLSLYIYIHIYVLLTYVCTYTYMYVYVCRHIGARLASKRLPEPLMKDTRACEDIAFACFVLCRR